MSENLLFDKNQYLHVVAVFEEKTSLALGLIDSDQKGRPFLVFVTKIDCHSVTADAHNL